MLSKGPMSEPPRESVFVQVFRFGFGFFFQGAQSFPQGVVDDILEKARRDAAAGA